jgi:hypothetical protein
MAERKSGSAPQGEVKTSEETPKNSEGAAEEAASGSPVEKANKAAAEASDERIKVLEEVGKVYLDSGIADDTPITAGADTLREEAAKVVEDGVKTDDEDRVIGVDGINPVSNENPDPRAVR